MDASLPRYRVPAAMPRVVTPPPQHTPCSPARGHTWSTESHLSPVEKNRVNMIKCTLGILVLGIGRKCILQIEMVSFEFCVPYILTLRSSKLISVFESRNSINAMYSCRYFFFCFKMLSKELKKHLLIIH